MKNEIILWLSSLVLVFLIGYIKNITDTNYPITGTLGIEGKKVSYKLDKTCFEKTSYKNIIISDLKGIEAKILWINNDEQKETSYKEIERGFECEIPKLKPGQKIKYKVIINYKDNTFEFPKNNFVALTFWGSIPSPVKIFYFILMYGGLVMSLRSLLELFNNNKNLKKYAVINCTLFITLITLIYPLYNTYKLGAINHFIPPFSDLVNPLLLIILVSWIIGTILIFNKIYIRTVTVFVSMVTLLIFFLT